MVRVVPAIDACARVTRTARRHIGTVDEGTMSRTEVYVIFVVANFRMILVMAVGAHRHLGRRFCVDQRGFLVA